MRHLSKSIGQIRSSYQVVVIGSGYGGGVAASRLARAGQSVCLLERGKEFLPGDFPDNLTQAAKEFQVDLPHKHIGDKTGLYDFRINEDMNVFLGCGLGGTSLVNANVSLQAEPRVFQDEVWPVAIREEAGDCHSDLSEGYERAYAMLKPTPYPDDYPCLPKLEAHKQSALGLGLPVRRTPINVTFSDGINHVGVEQPACNNCGDCVSGCNVGAKNTTAMNYLPDAVNHSAEIFTEIKVSRIEKAGERWRVYYSPSNFGRSLFDAPELFVLADIVMLGAGSLGSTEILQRSKAHGLSLSDRLGTSFTGNGDVLAFGYNCDQPINGIGFGDNDPKERAPVGPCITSVIEGRKQPELNDGVVIEEGSLPGAIAPILPGMLSAAAKIDGVDSDEGLIDKIQETARIAESAMRGSYHGAVHNTQTYLVMSHDDSDGSLYLDEESDRLRVSWPGIGDKEVFKGISAKLHEATKPLGGTYLPNPIWKNKIWNTLFGHDLVTVHPLGGCGMAERAERGVVNGSCQVFSGNSGDEVHKGLYVCDGAVMPRSLGVNPLLTITAVAERACILMARENGWNDGYSLTSEPTRKAFEPKLGIQFTETMRGYFSRDNSLDFEAADRKGKEDNSTFEFTLTVLSDDLDTLLDTEKHSAAMLGTANVPELSDKPLTITEGRFNLFIRDPDEVGLRRMVYRMKLVDETGRNYYLHGYKLVHDDIGLDVWPDTSTLYITLYDGPDEHAPLLGKGILHIRPDDFAKQMQTMKPRNAKDLKEGAEAVTRFGSYFAGSLAETYLSPLAPFRVFDPDAPPRSKRPLRVGEPEIYSVDTDDGFSIRLARYRGGSKGPVMLAHGLGVSSKIFSTDTINTNLLEYLYAADYDVWLLDFRASIELPAAKSRSNADDVAQYDYPAAVEKIRTITGSESIQVVAHCYGATCFTMAMLNRLKGVRSAVISQISAHYKTPLLTNIKCGLYVPSVLDALGVQSLTAYRDSHANWMERLLDNALRLYPQEFEEKTNSPVDKRITFLYGQLWELDQLNTETHDNLHEMFGVANIEAFEHLALLTRTGHAVGHNGDELYMGHLDRMAIPVRFIHGAENQTFLPESTELTLKALQQANGESLYDRLLIPNYGHIDCIFGKNAARDVYPLIREHLDKS